MTEVTCPSCFHTNSLPAAPGRGESYGRGGIHTSGYRRLSADEALRGPGHAQGANHRGTAATPGGGSPCTHTGFLLKPGEASREGQEQPRKEDNVPAFPVPPPHSDTSCPSWGSIRPGRRASRALVSGFCSQFTSVHTSRGWDHQGSPGSRFPTEISHRREGGGEGIKHPTEVKSHRALPTFSQQQD